MTPTFKADSELGRALSDWHNSLRDDRGTRAELRRCNTTAAIIMTPTFHYLCQRWRPWIPENRGGLDRLAAVIGLVAQLDEQHNKHTIAKQMAQAKGGGPIISELRFRRLLQQQDRNELYPAMIRILRQLGREADRHSLAGSIYFWGDKVRKEWAYDYYGNVGT